MPQQIGHDLDDTTTLYVDVYIALELLHCTYPEYIQRTTALERQLYQLYLGLKHAKERHAQWHAEHDAISKDIAERAIVDPRRTG